MWYLKSRKFCDHKLLRSLFLRFRHGKKVFFGTNFWDLGILWKQCGVYFCDSNVLTKILTKSKNDTIYMGIIYTSSLSRNLLCKNIYTMSSFIMSRKLFNGLPSNSHSSSSSLSSFLNCVAKKSTLYWLACVSAFFLRWLFPLINRSI